MDSVRTADVKRTTKETEVEVSVNLDGSGHAKVDTGLPFFDHLLHQFAFHGRIDVEIKARGDLEVDDHHTVEDVGICLGKALNKALGDREGIRRIAWALVPMDEALVECAVDISGRPYFVLRGYQPRRDKIGCPPLSTENVSHFWKSFCDHAGVTMHVAVRWWDNDHHAIEAMFKAVGRALGAAKEVVDDGVPSTKGTLRRG
ncbi:imidazoleglycerol-phosphate dehydratase HisB [Methanopyrus sp. SNP6]|uniref:imidazoleglycerol-phosphate dehydratase HisB n=1 Tax=Methanopyrus sp. SNP6 TaxID=1937005 RepID=UPI001AEF92C6